MTLREFADRLGADPGYLSKIENGKAQNVSLRFQIRVALEFKVSAEWLRTGKGKPTGAIEDQATQKTLQGWSEKRIQRVMSVLDDLPDALATNIVLGHLLRNHSLQELQEEWHKIPGFADLPAPARLFWNDAFMRCQYPKLQVSSTKQDLTDTETTSKVSGNVKTRKPELELPSLLERLKQATMATGKKSELAAYLQRVTKSNVPLASVSRWLSGEREPGGEVALQLDAWATAQGFPRAK